MPLSTNIWITHEVIDQPEILPGTPEWHRRNSTTQSHVQLCQMSFWVVYLDFELQIGMLSKEFNLNDKNP